MATLINRERSNSESDVETNSLEALAKKRHTIADVGATLINVLRFQKGTSGSDNTTNHLSKENVGGLEGQRTSVTIGCKSDTTSTTSSSKFRRRNTFRGLSNSITGFLRLRTIATKNQKPTKPEVTYENTYKMGPDTGKHIAITQTEQEAGKVLQDVIGETEYNQKTSGAHSVKIANMIKEKVKAMNFPRYRVVVQIVITQVCGQGIETASRCVWDASVDNYSCVTYQNDTTVAMAMIYGVYLE